MTPRGSGLSAQSSSADGRSQEGRASGEHLRDAAAEAAREAVAEATRASTPTGELRHDSTRTPWIQAMRV